MNKEVTPPASPLEGKESNPILDINYISQNGLQPFEAFPDLAKCLLHAASFWKVDSEWSTTLARINDVCIMLLQERDKSSSPTTLLSEGKETVFQYGQYIVYKGIDSVRWDNNRIYIYLGNGCVTDKDGDIKTPTWPNFIKDNFTPYKGLVLCADFVSSQQSRTPEVTALTEALAERDKRIAELELGLNKITYEADPKSEIFCLPIIYKIASDLLNNKTV